MERLELDHKLKPDILMHFLLSYITAHNHSDVYYRIILQVHLWAVHTGRVPTFKTARWSTLARSKTHRVQQGYMENMETLGKS